MSKCSGCFPYFQDNQLGHMMPGGCMYIDDDVMSIISHETSEEFNEPFQDELDLDEEIEL